MNKSDFDRLKAVCEKEGFIIDHFNGLYAIKEKEYLGGVEFCRVIKEIGNNCKVGQICKLDLLNDLGRNIWIKNNCIEPSTESEYIDQLKSDAFKRFGEINEGDRFERPEIKGAIRIVHKGDILEWDYIKADDQLFCYNAEIYSQGKWATRLPERVKVEFSDHIAVANCDFHTHSFDFFVHRSAPQFDPEKVGEFLAQKLEEYLNQ